MTEVMLDYILSLLPQHFRPAVKNYFSIYPFASEIRLRVASPLSFTEGSRNIITALTVSRADMDYVVNKLTDSNMIICEPLIRQGYIPLKYNLRAGVGGDAFVTDGFIKSIRRISYINIRIPFTDKVNCDSVLNYISGSDYRASLLIISAPGGGKTTLLRSVSEELSTSPHSKRVSIIDTNRELAPYGLKSSLMDIFSGYPKAEGISIATRYFNPQYIVCDELGTSSETKAISEALNAGVPIITSAHATDISEVKRRRNLSYLMEKRVFDSVVKISGSENNYIYNIMKI